MVWTQGEKDQAKTLLAAGLNRAAIALRLGKTEAAVCGFLWRANQPKGNHAAYMRARRRGQTKSQLRRQFLLDHAKRKQFEMIGSKIEVLDHGFVRLVDCMGDDLSIVRAARVSYDAAWRTGENEASDLKLIKYLWKNQHTSPFEAVEFQFEVKAPLFVLRQWHRHRTWSYNELSARYRELPEEFYVPSPTNIGEQSKDNKQARDITTTTPEGVLINKYAELELYAQHCKNAFDNYKILLSRGWPRELARMVLPLSTYSHMFGKVNLKNLLHFLSLRTHSHAQYEIRVYANALLSLIRPVVPIAVEAWKENKRHEDQPKAG